MQNAMTCHMQKQFSSISETVQSSQNSSNSCTVGHFSIDLTRNWCPFGRYDIRVPRHACGRHTRRAKSLMPTRHQRDPRVARCDQTHLAVIPKIRDFGDFGGCKPTVSEWQWWNLSWGYGPGPPPPCLGICPFGEIFFTKNLKFSRFLAT